MIVSFYIEDDRIDLFDNETIQINQSVKDIKDLSKVFNDYSNSITVPASPKNNQIFKHYYNVDIFGGYDARVKTPCRIEIDGVPFREGKLQLNAVKIEKGKPLSYKIQFFSGLTSLKDLFGEDKLTDLEYLDNYNHTYNSTEVEQGFTVGLSPNSFPVFIPSIKYPLISYKRRFYLDYGSAGTNDETQVNIAPAGDGVDWQELKPAILVSEVLRSVEEQYGFTFTNQFTSQPLFRDLYMAMPSLNQDETAQTDLVVFDDVEVASSSLLTTRFFIDLDTVSSVLYKIRVFLGDEQIYESGFESGNFNKTVTVPNSFATGTYQARVTIQARNTLTFSSVDIDYEFRQIFGGVLDSQTFSDTDVVIPAPQVEVRSIIPEMKVFEFIDMLKQTFNLVIIPISENEYYLNDLNSWYIEGKIYDVTKYINTEEIELEKNKLYKAIDFKFKSNDTFLAYNFRQQFKRQYGAINENILIDGEPIDGDTLKIELPLEKPVFERLFNLEDDTLSTVQYGYLVSDSQDPFNVAPFLFYAPSVNTSSIKFVRDSGTANKSLVNMPSQSLSLSEDSFAFNFSNELSEFTALAMPTNIYSVFWQDYVNDMMSRNRRLFKLKGKFPLALINKLQTNDRLVIDQTRYIINTNKIKLNNGEVILELMNDVFTALLPTDATGGRFQNDSGLFTSDAQTGNFLYYDTSGEYKATTDDGWIDLGSGKVDPNKPFFFTISENETGDFRQGEIDVNGITYTVVQDG